MGYVSTEKRDLSKHETIYEHPDAERLLAPDRRTLVVVETGAGIEVLAGLGAVALAVIGIDGHRPLTMAAVATLLLGIALVTQGGAIASRWRAMLRRLDGMRYDRAELIGGIGTEVFGGLVGIVIAIIAMAGVVPRVLIPIAVIVFGAALLLGGAAQPELASLGGRIDDSAQVMEASGGIMVIVGIAAAVLGILALLEVGPAVVLALIALLCVGGALTFAGGALAARLLGRLA